MNELNRMRKLAGILTEGVMAVPPLSQRQEPNEIDEMFDEPMQGQQDPTMNMQSVSEGGGLDDIIQQKIQRAQELQGSMVDPEEVSDIIYSELEQDGHSPQDIEQILNAIADELSGANNMMPNEGGICPSCNGSGEEQGEYGADDFDEPDEYDPADDWAGDLEETVDLNNGYDDVKFSKGSDYFPNGADGPVTSREGPSGAKQGDNPEQKKMAVAEAHKELVYNYRKFLKESSKK